MTSNDPRPSPTLVLGLAGLGAAALGLLVGAGVAYAQPATLPPSARSNPELARLLDAESGAPESPESAGPVTSDLNPPSLPPLPASEAPESAGDPTVTPVVSPTEPPTRDQAPTFPLDLRTATVEELQRLPGIGQTRAECIVLFREQRALRSVRDLRRIHGFGRGLVRALKPYVFVSRQTPD